jgi:hypothetical protein
MRDSGLRALDVGAGPGPAAYALLDFSQAINQAVSELEDTNDFKGLRTASSTWTWRGAARAS